VRLPPLFLTWVLHASPPPQAMSPNPLSCCPTHYVVLCTASILFMQPNRWAFCRWLSSNEAKPPDNRGQGGDKMAWAGEQYVPIVCGPQVYKPHYVLLSCWQFLFYKNRSITRASASIDARCTQPFYCIV
jgi:hypothetical protein